MALNNNVKELIRNVVNNDLEKAKQYSKIILENETSEKNKHYCRAMIEKLESQPKFLELPYNMQNFIKIEDLTNFNDNRYYLTTREKNVFEQINIMKQNNEKLSNMGLKYLNSTMLYGESGTGKTTFGKYVAYKLKLPFAYINFSYLIDSHLGETSKNINKVFDYISNQKCVLLLDEIDTIGIKRGKDDLGEMARVTISLMQNLDRVENDLIIIGATNRIDMIDSALLRRFAIQHEVKQLESEEVYLFISKIFNDLGVIGDVNNIYEYAKEHFKQSEIITDITKAIVKMLNDNEKKVYLYW